ncbi:hypothetical protein [Halosegnis marinus]|uniref:Uncharacterized protein n=1 Tax=Halosegnis marinus TaxID=3034023 RepID=A0ABD5ZQX1_9EURY|nr:hypothetical protein [Halosegnis sp. DT85]
MTRPRARRLRAAALVCSLAVAATAAVGRALAHGGSLGSNAGRSLAVPTWLFLSTGGAVVGASFLLSSFATDRAFLRRVHGWRRDLPAPSDALATAGRALGLVGLAVVLVAGFVGPTEPLRNAAVLLVWAGWWAGLAMSAYLVGNAWPVLNPWRSVARVLPSAGRDLPVSGAWLSTVGLLVLIWIEVVSPLADAPRLLAAVVVAYSVVALGGALLLGDRYFAEYDPVSRVFRFYGAVAPVEYSSEEGLRLRVPGSGLERDFLAGSGEVAFVVALLWGTTFDGLVATPPWGDFARAAVGRGMPPALLYPLALAVGFVAFYGAYLLAVRYGVRVAETRRDPAELARRFAPSLLAIAAGYHVAHYLGYFLSLVPALAGALANPFAPGQAYTLVVPGWLGGLSLTFVLLGHLLAVWVAHAVAYDLFPSRLQAVRSQYALTLVMVFYTMTSLWIVSRPYAAPPFL